MSVGFMGGKFLPFHLGHLYNAVEAHNCVDKLYIVLSSSPNRDKELCERDGIKYMPAEVRLSWLGEAFNDLDNVEILHIEDDQWDSDYNWEQGAKLITDSIPEKITHVFSSESEYSELFNKFYPFARHVVIDDVRKTVTISATELRKNLYDNWDKLPNYVRAFFTKRVVVMGTESTGKSTLVKKLAKFFNTNFVHEIGRDYCEKYKNQLTVKMFDQIAMRHSLAQEDAITQSNRVLFVDSEALITQYYLKMYHDKFSVLLDILCENQNFDLCLFLEPDVAWVADGFRFQGDFETRAVNNAIMKEMMFTYDQSYVSISGNYSERFKNARSEVLQLLYGDKTNE